MLYKYIDASESQLKLCFMSGSHGQVVETEISTCKAHIFIPEWLWDYVKTFPISHVAIYCGQVPLSFNLVEA